MIEVLENTNQSIKDAYQKAIITSKKESKFENVAAACAIAEVNEQGNFKTIDVVEAYSRLTKEIKLRGKQLFIILGKLC